MTLFDIVKKNIIGNSKNYFLYFITMSISIVIYYTFVSLQSSKEIKEILEHSGAMQSTFLISSMILTLFSLVFILYSNSFFIRKRKKEIGLYAIVGVPKKTISKMLFFENLVMGVAALIIGIFFGTLLSKFFSMVLVKLIGAQLHVGFTISASGIISTITVFSCIFLLTSYQGYRLIYKFKLIELFKAESQGEKRPKVSFIIAIAGIILLVASYILATKPLPRGNRNILLHTFVLISGMIAGTYLFFHSSVAFLLKLLQKFKKYYYHGTNLIGTSQLLYRINGNIRTFTIIALISSLTISLFGSMYAQYSGFEKASINFAPFSYTHISKGELFDQKVFKIVAEDTDHPLIAKLEVPIIEADADFTTSDNYETSPTKIISNSTYQQVSDVLYGDMPIVISDDEAIAIRPFFTSHTSADYKGKDITIHTSSADFELTFTDMLENRAMTWDYPDLFIIVSDANFQKIAEDITPSIFKAYEVENEKTSKATTEKLMSLNEGESDVFKGDKKNKQIYSFYTVYQDNLESSALNMFVIGFLGLIFLAATGSILYFKQLTEATENKPDYIILRKIGVTKHERLLTVAMHNLYIFALPLTLGIVDSIILLNFLTKLLSALIGLDIGAMLSIALTTFIIIYLFYYLLTIMTYNRIVNDLS